MSAAEQHRGGESAPLSDYQRQVWLHAQMAGGIPLYNETVSVVRRGALEMDILERCFVELVRRHEVWRTTIKVVDGEPAQFLHPAPRSFKIANSDLRELPESERETEACRLATENARRPFDLQQGPLLRALLVRITDNEYRLFVTFHLLVFDGVTGRAILLPELAALYGAFLRGEPSPLAPLPAQYADFARWQAQAEQQESLAQQLEYWKERLGGEVPLLSWPDDRLRPSMQGFRGELCRVALPGDLIESARALSGKENVSPHITLLAAFIALLRRYTGQDDIVVGGISEARKFPGTEGVAGCFMNPIPLRFDLSGSPTFRQMLARVRSVVTDAQAHAGVPFSDIVKALQVRPEPGRSPLFQIIFACQPEMAPLPTGWGLAAEEISNGCSKADLMVVVDDQRDRVSASITYNPELFDLDAINRMAGHWQTMLAEAIAYPERRISHLKVMSDAERHQILVDWNNTAANYPTDKPLHKFYEDQVERTPDATALVCETQELTYRTLNERSNCVAHYLRKLGVGPDVLVGVCAERSVEMVLALLGILKAGGAYVPLDPEYPQERLNAMLQDALPPVVLTQERLLDRLPEGKHTVICLDRDWSVLKKESKDNPAAIVGGKNLAYAIYTSGSTGKPKGAPNVHEGVVNQMLWMQDTYKLSPTDRVLQKTPYSFDVSVFEFFWPLMNGACLVMARPNGHKDPSYLVDVIVEQKITNIHFVPSMLAIFLETDGIDRCKTLRRVFASGEALPFETQRRFFEQMQAELHNLYGPTEAAVHATYWRCRPDSKRSIVPIGRPVANTQIYILDSDGEPVPMGIAGELHIGGRQLARGYLNRPDLTAERFVADPFSAEPGARLYKTGDVARYLSSGDIEYLGRLDHQVKIRGFRIELGEIESVIKEFPGILQVVVVAREDVPGDKRLVAYVVPVEVSSFQAAALRDHLREKLPEYMLPAAFVTLETLPLSSNGKINRRALPTPAYEDAMDRRKYVAPRTQTERTLATLWAEVLGMEKVSTQDNFFDLGGHSLLAVVLFARISKTFGNALSLNTLFQSPTIAQLARLLDEKVDSGPRHRLVAIQSKGAKPPLFWLPGGIGSVMAFREVSLLLGKDRPVYGLESQLPKDGRSFEDVAVRASHFVEQVRSVQPQGPYNLIGFCSGGLVAYEMTQQLEAQGQEVAFLGLAEATPTDYPGAAFHRLQSKTEHYMWRGRRILADGPAGLARWLYRKSRAILDSAWNGRRNGAGGNVRATGPTVAELAEVVRMEKTLERIESRYRPKPYKGKAYLFIGNDDYFCQGVSRPADPRLAWRRLISEDIEIESVPGDHMGMLRKPGVDVFARKLKDALQEVELQSQPEGQAVPMDEHGAESQGVPQG